MTSGAGPGFGGFDRLILDTLSDAIVVADDGNRIVYLNPSASRLLGWAAGELVGQPLVTIMPPRLRPAHLGGFRRYLRTREPHVIGRTVRVAALRRDGAEVVVDLTLSTFETGGRPLFAASLRDVTEHVELERQAASARYLEAASEVAARLGREQGEEAEAASTVLELLGDGLGWQLGVVWLAEPTSGELACLVAWEGEGTAVAPLAAACRELRFPRGAGIPGRVWATGEPVWTAEVAAGLGPERAAIAAACGLRRAVAVPVTGATELLGTLELFGAEPGAQDADLVRMLLTVGAHLGQWVERRALERRAAFLSTASELLAGSLDLDELLRRAARLVVEPPPPRGGGIGLADWCSVDLLAEDGAPFRVLVMHTDEAKQALADELRRYPPGSDRGSPVLRALRTGEPQLVDPEVLIRTGPAREPRHVELLRALGARQALILPLIARQRTLGAMALASARPGRFGAGEVALATDLARRVALAVDNARLYQERGEVASALQRSLLPPTIPAIGGVEITARYLPGRQAIGVGGDFYDVFATGPDEWVVLIGDVSGTGATAAALTGVVRYAARALALQGQRPAAALGLLNQTMLTDDPDALFCTLLYGSLQVEGGTVSLTLASAGHPLPLLVRAGGELVEVPCSGTLLGAFREAAHVEATVSLSPGDALVLYTDGVTEALGERGRFGDKRFRRTLAEGIGRGAADLAARVETAVTTWSAGRIADDFALLVLRVPPA